jgi:hypothetical protein
VSNDDDRYRVASNEELDDRYYGDPLVRFSPRRWEGPDYSGSHFSECPPDFLQALADALVWRADMTLKDAARARGWARRKGAQPAPMPF